MFFTKAKRAQNVDDYETWIQGWVVPTLNAMDNSGESFATVLIVDGTRVDDVRVYEDGIVPTVISRYGTGGGNVPMVFPIQDGRGLEKNQNGLGIGDEDSPAYTLDRTGGQSVAIPIQGTVIGRADTSGPQGKGFSEDGSPMFTLTKTDIHAVSTTAYKKTLAEKDEEHWQETEISRNVATNNIGNEIRANMLAENQSTVRRLTPTECERLQGFPDNWTDGQADSNRYKQMGNAVAVPVVQWIINRMIAND